MKSDKCINCGANDFKYINGYKICNYCETKYKIEEKTETIISIKKDIEQLLKKCEEDSINREKYINLILDLDANNKEVKKYF